MSERHDAVEVIIERLGVGRADRARMSCGVEDFVLYPGSSGPGTLRAK